MANFSHIRGLAFDLDGTLVDSIPGLSGAVNAAFHEMKLTTPTAALLATWIGNGADIMVQRALTWSLGREPAENEQQQARTLFDKFYADTVQTGSTLFPQVAETLAVLAGHNYPLALVTNKPSPFIKPLLTSLGIAPHFSLLLGGDDVVAKKPHPAPLFLVLGHFGLQQQELLFVGDSRNDILAAQAAGCPSVGMTYGYNYGEPIQTCHPELVLDNFNDLLPALGL